MTVLLCSVFSILRYKEHRNILYLTWTGSANPQLFRTGPAMYNVWVLSSLYTPSLNAPAMYNVWGSV